jgi:hypothetical protein
MTIVHLTVPEAPVMQLQPLNATALLVLWERPDLLGAELLGYQLDFRPRGETSFKKVILTDDRTRHILLQLGTYVPGPSESRPPHQVCMSFAFPRKSCSRNSASMGPFAMQRAFNHCAANLSLLGRACLPCRREASSTSA